MKMTTLGIALSLLVGCTALEARGNFRGIYESMIHPTEKRVKAINYLQTKMVETYKLREEGELHRDLYLFQKFVKSNLLAPEPIEKESFYRAYRASTLFMLRSADDFCEPDFSSDALYRVMMGIAKLKGIENIKNILTPEAIAEWVKNSSTLPLKQVTGNEWLAQSIIILAWQQWTRKQQ